MGLPYSLFTFLWRGFLGGCLCGFPQNGNGHFVTSLPCDYAKTMFGSPGSSAGKESTCSAGDSGSISGSGRSAGEGICYLLRYSWASLVAQLVKNPPAVQETWVQSLGWEDPWKREQLPTPVFWPGEFQGLYSPWCHKESDTPEWLSLQEARFGWERC